MIATKPHPKAIKSVFTKENRLLLPLEYQRVFKKGTTKKGSFFVFVFCENNKSQARLGLAIAKRMVAKAVARNGLKRMIRESFRQQQSLLEGMDVVVMVKGKGQNEGRAALFEELNAKWQLIAKHRKKSC